MEKQPKLDYSDIKFKDNGKLKLIIVVGTRPERSPVTLQVASLLLVISDSLFTNFFAIFLLH